MKKLYWQVFAALCGAGIIAVVVMPVFLRPRESDRPNPNSSCQSNLKNIGLGLKQYIQDNGEKYPPVSTSGAAYGWADALQPYLKSTQIFQCAREKSTQSEGKPRQINYTDYWYNRNLARIKTEKITESALLITFADGNDGSDQTDARYSRSTLPAGWIADKTSPLYRHKDGANYAFADGHVKWFKPEKISDSPPSQGAPTFRVQ